MTGNLAQQALGIGTTSPYPQSFDGSGLLFWSALFGMLTVTCLCTMLGMLLGNHLARDRKLGFDSVAALRTTITMSCLVLIMLCAPNFLYMVSYHEGTPKTLQMILTVQRACQALCVLPLVVGVGTFFAYYAEIVLRLRSPNSRIWTDYRLASLKRFAMVVVLSGALAASVTIGVAFR
jgi:hypothetical protein